MNSIKKPVRRKVLHHEKAFGRVPGWILDLECGHIVEIHGWGNGAGIGVPITTICPYCSGRRPDYLKKKRKS